MTNYGDLSRIADKSRPDYLIRRIAALEEQVRRLTTANTLQAATVKKGGISITEGGSLRVIDQDGHVVAIFGALPAAYNRADGSAQPGVMLAREDGSNAAVLGDLNPTVPPYRQSWQVLDRAANVIMADDTNSGRGLAVPWVPLQALVNTDVSTWPKSSSTAWTQIAVGSVQRQNPGFAWALNTYAPAATTGHFRITIDGSVVATSPTVTNAFAFWQGTYYWPAGWAFNSTATLGIEAQVTAGTAAIAAAVYALTGVQS